MKIAIPSNDGKTIFPKMLGLAKEFYIFNISSETINFLEKRINPYEKTLQHLKTFDVYDLIKDCDTIIVNMIGKKGRKRIEDKGVRIFIRNGEIESNLQTLLQSE